MNCSQYTQLNRVRGGWPAIRAALMPDSRDDMAAALPVSANWNSGSKDGYSGPLPAISCIWKIILNFWSHGPAPNMISWAPFICRRQSGNRNNASCCPGSARRWFFTGGTFHSLNSMLEKVGSILSIMGRMLLFSNLIRQKFALLRESSTAEFTCAMSRCWCASWNGS